MDTLITYRRIIQDTLLPYTQIPYAYGELECEAVFDQEHDRYMLVTLGWDRGRRIHSCIVHVEIINAKVWVQRDETEYGITQRLVEAGIPKHHIVLGFKPASVRPLTEYAVA